MAAQLEETFMSVGDVLVDSGSRKSAGELSECQSHKHTRVISEAQVDIGHQPFKNIACQILRPCAPVIVVEVLKLCPAFKSERQVICFGVVQWNEFQPVVRINALGWVAQKAPVLKPRKRAQRRPYRWLWRLQGRRVWRLRLQPGCDQEAQP